MFLNLQRNHNSLINLLILTVQYVWVISKTMLVYHVDIIFVKIVYKNGYKRHQNAHYVVWMVNIMWLKEKNIKYKVKNMDYRIFMIIYHLLMMIVKVNLIYLRWLSLLLWQEYPLLLICVKSVQVQGV